VENLARLLLCLSLPIASQYEKAYLDLLRKPLEGPERFDRTGAVTRSLFGVHLEVPLSEGFPLLTTIKVHFKSILYELFWFLQGETSIRCFHQNQITIWDE
jgi:thymidylate synthase